MKLAVGTVSIQLSMGLAWTLDAVPRSGPYTNTTRDMASVGSAGRRIGNVRSGGGHTNKRTYSPSSVVDSIMGVECQLGD